MDWTEPAAIFQQVAALVAGWIEEETLDSLSHNDLVLSAVCFQLILAGEAAKLMPAARKPTRSGYALRQMIEARNTLAHDPFDLTMTEVWNAITRHLPEAAAALEAPANPNE